MKLLSKKEIVNVRKQQDERELNRARRVRQVQNAEIKKLNDAREAYKTQTAEIRREYHTFVNEIEAQKRTLLNEVAGLEQRRINALKPLDKEREILEKKEKEIVNREQLVKKGEEKVNSENMALNKAKIDLSNKESGIFHRTLHIEKREADVMERDSLLKTKEKAFSEEQHQYTQKCQREQQLFAKERETLTQGKRACDVIQSEYKKQRTELDNEWKKLGDRQKSLKRGFTELKRKQKVCQ